ncbi:MAG: hypothetical protein ACTIBD_15140, partial [Pseudomonas taetrolens]
MLPHNVLLSRYQYDPLDRLRGAHGAQRFYNKTRLATVIEDKRNTCFFEHDAQPLALQRLGTVNSPGFSRHLASSLRNAF